MTSCAPDRLGQGPGSEWLLRLRGLQRWEGAGAGWEAEGKDQALVRLTGPRACSFSAAQRPGLSSLGTALASGSPSCPRPPTACSELRVGGHLPISSVSLSLNRGQTSPARDTEAVSGPRGPGPGTPLPPDTCRHRHLTGHNRFSRKEQSGKPRPPAASPDPALNHPTVSERRSIGWSPHPGLSSGAAALQPCVTGGGTEAQSDHTVRKPQRQDSDLARSPDHDLPELPPHHGPRSCSECSRHEHSRGEGCDRPASQTRKRARVGWARPRSHRRCGNGWGLALLSAADHTVHLAGASGSPMLQCPREPRNPGWEASRRRQPLSPGLEPWGWDWQPGEAGSRRLVGPEHTTFCALGDIQSQCSDPWLVPCAPQTPARRPWPRT